MRLELKEQESYNFNTIMKEYSGIHDSFQTSDYFARNVCLRAFEHLLQRELISLVDSRGHTQSVEYHPVKLLISAHELHLGLKSYSWCPVSWQKKIWNFNHGTKYFCDAILQMIPRLREVQGWCLV
ncbi:Origin of replication complex subunit [Heracleum sosnowskyi]|uniref:Origin of replication complex subunit n=1 Tax=Heracleum sosnowskyi TaxID=360622 RepID=A0AAD8HAD9_9APIA|nr:Origin of replication complex subunit [Heracleum sosnowskyi]